MATLRYPADLDTTNNDFIQFAHYPYRVNDAIQGNWGFLGGGTGTLGDENAPENPDGHRIQLYMPNSTPGVQQMQGWNGQTFEGARGQMIKQLLDGMAGLSGAGGDAGKQSQFDPGALTSQIYLEFAAGLVGQDASTALQLGQGKVFNPNVEMLYKMPLLRKFTFDFNFIPKSPDDTKAVDLIIREFKKWSSPGIEGSKYLTVPDLWKVTYFSASADKVKKHVRMNPFKPAVIEGLVTMDNPMSDLHTTIADPSGDVPVHTKMTLNFCETDIVTRRDHDNALSQGYLRGA